MHHGNFELSLPHIGYGGIRLTMSTVPYLELQICRNSLVGQQASFRERAFDMAQATSSQYALSRKISRQ